MLRTLIESRRSSARNQAGTAASAAIHLTLIILAAFATAAGAPAESKREPPTKLHWVTPQPASPTRQTPGAPRTTSKASPGRRLPSISLAISTSIPSIEIPLGVVRGDEFAAPSSGGLTSGDPVMTGSERGNVAYDAFEVDKAVAALPGVAPVYPAALRAAGVEGEVRAQFVVNDHGRADVSSLRILSSTNDQFSEAVRQSLPRMRFVPAQLRGRPVAQTVQQLFSFRLSR